jgi:hypothetical protein
MLTTRYPVDFSCTRPGRVVLPRSVHMERATMRFHPVDVPYIHQQWRELLAGVVIMIGLLSGCTTMHSSPPQEGTPGAIALRQCNQLAFSRLGWYDGPIDGLPSEAWKEAVQGYMARFQLGSVDYGPQSPLRRALMEARSEQDYFRCMEATAMTSGRSERPSAGASAPTEPSQGSLSYLDFKNGFRDLKFGDPYPQDMRLIEESGETKYYTRASDDLTIGRSLVRRIVYGFYKGRFYAVLIDTEGYTNSRALLEVLREAYGPGTRPNRFMDTYYWNGARVLLSYDEKPLSHEATVIYTSVPLSDEKKAEDKAKSRKGVSGL